MNTVILLALFTNWLMNNPIYNNVLTRFTIYRKPFNCSYCMAFWLALSYSFYKGEYNIETLALMPSAASFTAATLERWVKSLPIKI